VQKVLITHDFITSKNFDFIPRILFFIKKILSTFGVKVYFGDNLFDQNFQQKFCSLNQINPCQEGKFFLKQFSPNQDSLFYLKSFLDSFDLIIGYELSEITKESINSLQKRYIDIWLSPIRFLNDLNFCLSSNNEKINQLLSKNIVASKQIFQKANQIIDNHNIENPEKSDSSKRANLIVTQSIEDKSLVKASKYLKLSDFRKEILRITQDFSCNYILKHPNLTHTQYLKIVEDLSIPNLEVIEGNTYEILCSPNLKHLTSISSSLLEEAKYFGKDTTYLYQPVIDHRYICINEMIFKASFWQEILGLSKSSPYAFIHHDNYFRNLFGSAWGYHSFLYSETNMFEYNSVVSFLKFLGSLDKSKEYFLYGSGSISKFVIENTDMKIVGVIDRDNNEKQFYGLPVHEIGQIQDAVEIIITPFYDSERIKKDLWGLNCAIHFFR
jgi:hypothetical protein